MNYSRILGTGGYLPEHILTNADLEKLVDTNDQWIVERTGIRERRFVGEGEQTSQMAADAARQALKKAGLHAHDLDLIIVATSSPDYLTPPVSSPARKVGDQ